MPGYATICQGVQDKLVSLFDLDDVDVDDDDAAQFLNNNFNTINLLLFVLLYEAVFVAPSSCCHLCVCCLKEHNRKLIHVVRPQILPVRAENMLIGTERVN